ncbi:MAG: 2-C-methyl-D-erythritol 2,4-cyclodiphosphate synthase [Christensenellaceae bacterium]|jgi:2-C-methyl-D-erythritol 4-phosphate cytidylyltransferase/2-C-methyl-D-erythritol 2,4-cyclodiphosphate synthase|nr:2-C-methyl-D-erythritol 2,4-cyclodiphosphate synthase [Christensenellaceae bacterium]
MFDLVIVASGKSSRMGSINKIFFKIGAECVLFRTVSAFITHSKINSIIIVGNISETKSALSGLVQSKLHYVNGGLTRCESVESGLKLVTSEYVLVHDGARPFINLDLINRIIACVEKKGSAIPVIPIVDSVSEINSAGELIDTTTHSRLMSIQTPQGFITNELKMAFNLRDNIIYPDESSLYKKTLGKSPFSIEGDANNIKLTTPADLFGLNSLVGIGYDSHLLIPNRKLVLGGIEIASEMGTLAHSDGDALIHALIDALLSAMGSSDIGSHFPNTSSEFKDADSSILLSNVMEWLLEKHLSVSNISMVVILDKPKLSDYIPLMKIKISNILKVNQENIGISAKTSENAKPNIVEAFAAVKLL